MFSFTNSSLHGGTCYIPYCGVNTNPLMLAIEFRHHSSSKDKTIVTHWIRFCIAFVLNSSRLRSPMALKSTTSIDEEFELLFESQSAVSASIVLTSMSCVKVFKLWNNYILFNL